MAIDNTLIFMTPILDGKSAILKENIFQEEDKSLLADLGITKYHRWIQTINESDFLIHQLEGKNLKKSFVNLKDKAIQGIPSALKLQNLYEDALGVDIRNDHWIPQTNELTELMDMHIECNNGEISKEYCFVFPVLLSKQEKLMEFYADKAVYNSVQIQNIFKFRGMDKVQLWLQKSGDDTYLVVYQDIIGPVADARNKYLNSKEEAVSKYLSDFYSEFSGLPFEKLLPTLESLDDAEVLK